MNPIRFEMEQPEPCNNWHDHPSEGNTLLDLPISDDGAGKYAVLSCSNIGFDNLDEFEEWAGKVRAAIKMGLEVEA